MRLGLDSFSFHIALAAGAYDLFRTLDWMAARGLSGLQININGPRGRFLSGEPTDAAHLRRVRQALAQKGFFAEIGGGHATDAALVSRQLELAAAIGADVLRTVIGFHGTLAATIGETRTAMEEVLPLARRLGVRIAIENHEDVTAAELRELLDTLDDPFVGACLDTGNDLVVYGDPLTAARALAPRAFTTHLKDHRLARVAGAVYSIGVPLGAGDIDLPAIITEIRRASPLDRLLIQDTTGYASVLNPFKRTDLRPPHAYPGVPAYATPAEAAQAGLILRLDDLSPKELTALAAQQEQNLAHDIAYLRGLVG
ncbi:MAG TPA: sugar phosphate isomerase/epimerase family protein [Opitutaceae bacterium]|nr:sugar phosphate isomerase/epimerase family protein [Opitutaceae bacterium]